jgi:hypothetical protein
MHRQHTERPKDQQPWLYDVRRERSDGAEAVRERLPVTAQRAQTVE